MSPSKLSIRRFRPSDMGRVLEIEAACFPTETYPEEMFRHLYRDCGEMFFVACRGTRLIGYIVTCMVRRRAEIVSFAVDPPTRKRGVGTAMMERTLARLRAAGVRNVWLSVRTGSAAVIRLYRRFGFQNVTRVDRYYEDGSDALRMRLPLGR